MTYEEGIAQILELKKRTTAELGEIVRAMKGPDRRDAAWWEKLAADTGYSVRHLQNASHPSVGDSAAESKRLPRARHALSQLAPDELEELLQDLPEAKAKTERAEQNAAKSKAADAKREKESNETVLPLYLNLTGDLAKAREALQAFSNRTRDGELSILPVESVEYIKDKVSEVVDMAADALILFSGSLEPFDA